MEKDNAIKIDAETVATQEEEEVLPPTEPDYESKIKDLEDEKARLIEEGANYKLAYLKEKGKKEERVQDEDDDDKMRRIAKETLAESRLVEIAQEQDAIIKKALKENKELKLVNLNKDKTPPAGIGTHSEGQAVKDTLVTPEQMTAFKARGWSDKDIERYKKNLVRYGGR